MADKTTARALAVRGHPKLLEQIRPEHKHIREYVRSENAAYDKTQARWLAGYHRFGDELEALYAVAQNDSPRERAESVAVLLDDPWKTRGLLRSEVNGPVLAVFEALRGPSKKRGASLLWDSPPEYATEVIEWVGRYDIVHDTGGSWAEAVSSSFLCDPAVHRMFSMSLERHLTWPELLRLARSGVTSAQVRSWYQEYRANPAAGVRHLVDNVPLAEALDRDTLARPALHRAYFATDPLLSSLWDTPGKGDCSGLSTVGPGRYSRELSQIARKLSVHGLRDRTALAKLAEAVDDPWKLYGATTDSVSESYRLLWDSFCRWPGRLNMVALLDAPLDMADAQRYAQWLGPVSASNQGATYTTWEGLILSAATAKASNGWWYSSRRDRPWDIDRADLLKLMEATDPITVGQTIIRHSLTAPELVAHLVDDIPLDYIQAMQ